MNKDTQALIQSLTTELRPVHRRTAIGFPVTLWLILTWFYVIVITLYIGPLRAGALQALIHSPYFALETLTGFVAGGLFAVLAFLESIPGARKKWLFSVALSTIILWIGSYLLGLVAPALEPSMVGKRPHCVLEAYFYSGPPLISGYYLLFCRYPINSVRTGVFLGISAGAIPALLMQLSCMYMPAHILTHHIGPILPVAILGGALGYLFRKDKPQKKT